MIIFILLPRKEAKYICECAKLGYIPEIVRNKTIKHLKANILPTFDIYFMLSCAVKYFTVNILLAYPTMNMHGIIQAGFNFGNESWAVWYILRLLNSKSDINALENIYNGSLEVFEKIEPTPLRLNPLYIKVQFIRLKFSHKDKSQTFCSSGIPHLHELHHPRHHSFHHTHRHEHQYLQEGNSTK